MLSSTMMDPSADDGADVGHGVWMSFRSLRTLEASLVDVKILLLLGSTLAASTASFGTVAV